MRFGEGKMALETTIHNGCWLATKDCLHEFNMHGGH
jgi:hypothetical protein